MLVEAERDTYVSWDAFLETEADRANVRPEGRAAWLVQQRKSIEAYREFEWPKVRQELARDFHMEVPQGQEPHWTEPGSAVLWHHEIQSTRMLVRKSPSGAPIWELVDVDNGWKPTTPQPVNNGSQLAHYLRNGFRLRPPEMGFDVKAFESTAPADALQRPDEAPPVRQYICERHGVSEKRVFVTWKAYVQHCAHRREVLEEKPPPEVLEKAKNYTYYCSTHDKGYNNKRMAQHHVKLEMAKGGRSVHLSLEQMEMKGKGD